MLETLIHNEIRYTYLETNFWNHKVVVFGENSVRRNFRRRKFCSVKTLFGENSVTRKFISSKIPFGENSFGENLVGENSFSENSNHVAKACCQLFIDCRQIIQQGFKQLTINSSAIFLCRVFKTNIEKSNVKQTRLKIKS